MILFSLSLVRVITYFVHFRLFHLASKYIRVQGNVGESPFFAKYFDMFEIKHLVFIMNSFLSTFVYYCTLLCSGHFQFIFFMKDVAKVLTNLFLNRSPR